MTLVELLVVLVLLSILSGVAVFSYARGSVTDRRTAADHMLMQLTAARTAAVRSGKVVTVSLDTAGWSGAATVLPDGSIVCDSLVEAIVRCDRLSGRVVVSDDAPSVIGGLAP